MNRKQGKPYYLRIDNNTVDMGIISAAMNCRGCYRGVQKTISDMYGINVSLGHIYNVMKDKKDIAIEYNNNQPLQNISVSANDELFHINSPILAGVDIDTLYCYLLKKEDHRDGDTWGYHLIDLNKKAFNPNYTVCDYGAGLRSGQSQAMPGTPCHGDVFHIIKSMKDMLRFFKNRLKKTENYRKSLEIKQEKSSSHKKNKKHKSNLAAARKDEKKYRSIEPDLRALVGWMEHDILSISGSNPEERHEMYQFIVNELEKIEQLHPHRIKEVRTALVNQEKALLGFVDVMAVHFKSVAFKFNVPEYIVWEVCKLQKYKSNNYYERKNHLQRSLSYQCYEIETEVINIMDKVQRASSMIENFNSRVRPYLVVKKTVNNGFLDLLRFYMNHTPIERSFREERQGKTPAERLNKATHPHWLNMLGFSPLQKAA